MERYINWTDQVAAELRDGERKRSAVFERYAQVVEGITNAEAAPLSILLDFSKDGFVDAQQDDRLAGAGGKEISEIPHDDLCADVDPETGEFTVKIDSLDIPCRVKYREDIGKYGLESDVLNSLFPPKTTDGLKQPSTLVQSLNKDQSFRIIVKRANTVYSEGRFYEPLLRWIGNNGTKPILEYVHASECLHHVASEKGDQELYSKNRRNWYKSSIFGLFAAVGDRRLAEAGINEDVLTQ